MARCLALADALRERGANCTFVCREVTDSYAGTLAARGHELLRLPGQVPQDGATEYDAQQTLQVLAGRRADWLVVDSYALDANWERPLRGAAKRILAIDDLADRSHDCDVLLDQNFYDNASARYLGRVPRHCTLALGPSYALLRREFYEARRTLRSRDGAIRRVLVSLGGADEVDGTGKTLAALCQPQFAGLEIDVLVGALNRRRTQLLDLYGKRPNVHWHDSSANVAELMAAADLSIGAGGTMNWERCFLGLPSIVIVIAENQSETNEALHRAGIIVNLGWHAQVVEKDIASAVEQLQAHPLRARELSGRALALMTDEGAEPGQLKIVKLLTENVT